MSERALVARWSLVLITAFVLQVGLGPQVTVVAVVPDLMVMMAVVAGVVGGPERGAIVGFFSGLLFDLARPGPVGISALAYTLTGAAVGAVMASVLQVRRWLAMLVVTVGSTAGVLVFAVGSELFGRHTLANPELWKIVVVISLVNGVLSPLALWAGRWAEGTPEPQSATMGVVDG